MVGGVLSTGGVRRYVTDQDTDDVEESEDAESEEEEFELEGLMTREEGAAVLRRLADYVDSGSVELGGDEGPVSVPERLEVEFEYEEEDDEAELEVELGWSMVDGQAAPAEEFDEDEGDETEENEVKADEEEVDEEETDDEK